MKLIRILLLVLSLCVFIAPSCSKDETPSKETPDGNEGGGDEGEGEIPDLELADCVGRWDCLVETWDLTKEGTCTEIDPATSRPIKDGSGNPVTLSVQEYCKAFAAAYNAEYGPTYTIVPEDVAVREIESAGVEDYTYFVFEEDGTFEFHVCQDMGGLGFLNTLAIAGEATYHADTKTITLVDTSSAGNPRRMVLTLKSFSEQTMELSIVDEYPWTVSDFAGEHAYQVECTTIYTGYKAN